MTGSVLERGGDEQPQKGRHQADHQKPSQVLGQRELPADQDPEHQPELPHKIRGGELEGKG
jgi:hypothetical protein